MYCAEEDTDGEAIYAYKGRGFMRNLTVNLKLFKKQFIINNQAKKNGCTDRDSARPV